MVMTVSACGARPDEDELRHGIATFAEGVEADDFFRPAPSETVAAPARRGRAWRFLGLGLFVLGESGATLVSCMPNRTEGSKKFLSAVKRMTRVSFVVKAEADFEGGLADLQVPRTGSGSTMVSVVGILLEQALAEAHAGRW